VEYVTELFNIISDRGALLDVEKGFNELVMFVLLKLVINSGDELVPFHRFSPSPQGMQPENS
jgi:hypothetical protein